MRGEPTRTSAGRIKKRVVEQASPAFLGRRRVVINNVLQDFEQRIERCACLALRRGANNERLGDVDCEDNRTVLVDTIVPLEKTADSCACRTSDVMKNKRVNLRDD